MEEIVVLTEQAQEIGRLEEKTEQQEEKVEEIAHKLENLETSGRNDNDWLSSLSTRLNILEEEVNNWKIMNSTEAESEAAEEILEIPIPEAAEPAEKLVKNKKSLWSWLF